MTKETTGNQSEINIFTMQCFSEKTELQVPLFIVFLLIFLIIILGNIVIFATIISSSHLHTPMYVFLCVLSFLDISYASTTLPKLLVMLSTQRKIISFVGCITQLYFFLSFICTEFLLLAAMAYDRYVAICRPLHYTLLMSLKNCVKLLAASCIVGFLDPFIFALLIANLSFCASHIIDHFFCDVSPVLKLTCSDTSTLEILIYINGALVGSSAFILTSTSYIFIICSIMRIQSSHGQQKAFSTCASHLMCVLIFYVTIICLDTRPIKAFNPKQDKFFSLLYMTLIPLLNPLIYTLKNKDFKDSLRKLATKIHAHSKCNAVN
ncbi:olfactory receptor 1019 [Xenopus laevis]|uniref:Olfactory receptor n=2 Tax=Xenopus laevis TaxID=8355 RepID=A0A1L8FIK2_XENLA|nr:olfactory receptor 1019 [Xenopus laevis]OCT71405.1 hypothetical protein XELAEV_18034385mg [Xenopus laevis]